MSIICQLFDSGQLPVLTRDAGGLETGATVLTIGCKVTCAEAAANYGMFDDMAKQLTQSACLPDPGATESSRVLSDCTCGDLQLRLQLGASLHP